MFFFFFLEEKLKEFSKDIFKYAKYEVVEDDSIKMDDHDYNFYALKEEELYRVYIRNKMSVNLISKLKENKGANTKYVSVYLVYDYVEEETKKKISQEYNAEILDITNIIYIIQNNEELMKKLRELLDYSIDGIKKEKPSIYLDKLNIKVLEKSNYIEQLKKIKIGKEEWGKYQIFCKNVIKDIFSDDLDSWKYQSKTKDGKDIFDLIAKIKCKPKDSNDFFRTMEEFFFSKYIIFEFKNYSNKITDKEILTTKKYLYHQALRKVAIIFTRKGANERAYNEIRNAVKEEGKIILVIDDEELIQMLKLWRDRGINPAILLQEKLNNLLMGLDK